MSLLASKRFPAIGFDESIGALPYHGHCRVYCIIAGGRAVTARRAGSRSGQFFNWRAGNPAQNPGHIEFYEADIVDLDERKLACAGADYVLHQAAIPSVLRVVLDPIASNWANVDGTVNVLVAARKSRRPLASPNQTHGKKKNMSEKTWPFATMKESACRKSLPR